MRLDTTGRGKMARDERVPVMKHWNRRVSILAAIAVTLSVLVVPIAVVGAAAGPANDNLDNALPISDGYAATTDSAGATLEVDETLGSCKYGSPTWSVWYRFTAGIDGNVYLLSRMPGPNEVNFMSVFELTSVGPPSTLGTEVGCQFGGNSNRLSVAVTGGTEYAVQILGGSGDLGDLVTLEFETMGTLTGTVTDQGAGTPLLDIIVSALSTDATIGYGSTRTSADGTWTMQVPTRDMIVRFIDGAGGYASEFYDNATVKSGAMILTVTEGSTTSGIDAALADAGTLSGTITSSSGSPLAGASVALYDSPTPGGAPVRSAITGPDGTYLLSGVVPGTYLVRFSEPNHFTEWYDNVPEWTAGATPITITAGVDLVLDETLDQGGTISGVVTDDLGSPLQIVRVQAYSAEGVPAKSGMTDPSGAYAIQGLTAGAYAVYADSDASPGLAGDHASQWWNGLPASSAYADVGKITVSAGSTDTANFSLRRSTVSGTVTSADDSLPIEGIVVTLTESTSSQIAQTTTDVNGAYSFTVFPFSSPPLTVSFEATSVFFLDQTPASFAFTAGGDKVLDVVLAVDQKAPAITSTGLAASVPDTAAPGSAVTTATATDANRADTLSWSITGGNTGGAFSIDAATGAITTATTLDAATTSSYTLTVTVSDGALADATTVTVDVIPASTVTGTVTSADDSLPIEGVVVTLTDNTGTQIGQTATDTTGSYSFDSFTFTESPFTVAFEATSVFFIDTTTSGVAIAAGDTKVVDAVLTVDQQAPVVEPAGPFSLPEDSAVTTTVATVTAMDANRADTITWSITGGNTGGAFSIDSATGAITTATALDFETTTSYTLTVAASDGALQDSTTITINVTDVNEAIPSAGFIDTVGSVFEVNIDWMAYVGITKGCNPSEGNTKFCPDAAVTRGQMAAFLVRALKLTDRLDNPFTDDDGSIFEADIERLAAAGITKGCNPSEGNTKFCPDAKVTRGQMAAFLVRAMGYIDVGAGDLFVDDNESIFENDIDRLATAGVTRGCNPSEGNTMFCPTSYVTRGQMAAFLYRALVG